MIIKFFHENIWKAVRNHLPPLILRKPFMPSPTPSTAGAWRKNVNAKCGYVMQKYYLCSRKATPDRIGVYISLKKKKGKVLEWLKRHAWKACIRQKRIGGSNPPLSAISLQTGKRWSPMVCRLFSLYCLCSETVPFRYCLCFRKETSRFCLCFGKVSAWFCLCLGK